VTQKRSDKGQRRAADILEAARAILVEEGYAALTTRKIAGRAGIRQSNVQYYFPAKADLVRALFEATIARDKRATARPARSRRTPLARMLASVDLFLANHYSRGEQAFLRELWALSAHDADVAGVMNGFYRKWIELAARNVLAISPSLGRRRAERRALLIISLVDGLSLFRGPTGVDHRALDGIEREVRAIVKRLSGR
jgi:AcrR family transcriptional regulator